MIQQVKTLQKKKGFTQFSRFAAAERVVQTQEVYFIVHDLMSFKFKQFRKQRARPMNRGSPIL